MLTHFDFTPPVDCKALVIDVDNNTVLHDPIAPESRWPARLSLRLARARGVRMVVGVSCAVSRCRVGRAVVRVGGTAGLAATGVCVYVCLHELMLYDGMYVQSQPLQGTAALRQLFQVCAQDCKCPARFSSWDEPADCALAARCVCSSCLGRVTQGMDGGTGTHR